MSREDGADGSAELELVGMPVEAATDAVLAGDDSRDREAVRRALGTVAEDGVVSGEAIESRLGEVAKVVSTPETRVELAAMELEEAKETAAEEGVSDLDVVRARLETFESRLHAAEDRIEALGPKLRGLLDRRGGPGDAYEVAAGIRELRSEANRLQGTADELQVDIEEFGEWLTTPETRYDELEEEVDTVEGSLDELADAIEDLETSTDGEAAGEDTGDDPGLVWADAAFRVRVLDLLVADLRAELDDLRAWPDGEEVEGEGEREARAAEMAERLDGLEERRRAVADRLETLARPAWIDRFGDRIDGFEAALEGVEPPVPWGDVRTELERHRDRLGGSS
jgi:DNA repair exonuclease SbcCD ATPase subunit